ncbi:hypothetical protein NX02_27265 [Sphingomonas sanxanigenens DSM 19645 = NX02]|uniref:Uncharacterized protein n=1 Tax=Sphingomonas sanxanigenens DSM 19645 = NX02 TaxID=1123269 RepID=W0AGM5_9SPHN|nr:hypothetical protein NX02_27265 [Sphingomonas sanxanigenens DSM 19645 = NX02]
MQGHCVRQGTKFGCVDALARSIDRCKTRDRLTTTRYIDRVSGLNAIDQFAQMRLRVCETYPVHDDLLTILIVI